MYCQNPGRTPISYSTYFTARGQPLTGGHLSVSAASGPRLTEARPATSRGRIGDNGGGSPSHCRPCRCPHRGRQRRSRSRRRRPRRRRAGSRARAPLVRLALGLTLSLLTIIGFCLYAAHEIGRLRDEQMALSERNRRDSLQLIRVQNNLSTLAITLRDMTDRTEPYPMAAWASTFDRLELDLHQALELERTLAPARPAGTAATDRRHHRRASGRRSIARWRSPGAATRRRPSRRSAPTRCRATPSWSASCRNCSSGTRRWRKRPPRPRATSTRASCARSTG